MSGEHHAPKHVKVIGDNPHILVRAADERRAERDILRCQGADFADRLADLGVELKYVLIPGSVHLFITVAGQPTAFCRSVKESSEFISSHSMQDGK